MRALLDYAVDHSSCVFIQTKANKPKTIQLHLFDSLKSYSLFIYIFFKHAGCFTVAVLAVLIKWSPLVIKGGYQVRKPANVCRLACLGRKPSCVDYEVITTSPLVTRSLLELNHLGGIKTVAGGRDKLEDWD